VTTPFARLLEPRAATRYLFFGGKGGVGKTTLATATATRMADLGFRTTIVSTDPTVSLGAMFGQEVGALTPEPVAAVPGLSALTINPTAATGPFQDRLAGMMQQASTALGDIVSTPCAAEMAAFDQFVGFLDRPQGDVVVFDTAPTGTTLRELAMPFDWAGFLQKQIVASREVARLMGFDNTSATALEADKQRYDRALEVLRDRERTTFTLVLTPERLPVEETRSAASGLQTLGIPVQALVVNQTILPEVVEGNRFLQARSAVQRRYLDEIDRSFGELLRTRLPLLDRDVSDVQTLRHLGDLLFGPERQPVAGR